MSTRNRYQGKKNGVLKTWTSYWYRISIVVRMPNKRNRKTQTAPTRGYLAEAKMEIAMAQKKKQAQSCDMGYEWSIL